jgi:ankyrin repeat protein
MAQFNKKNFFKTILSDDIQKIEGFLNENPTLSQLKDDLGKSVLHYANSSKTASLLIRFGADVDSKDKYGLTPLHMAVYHNLVEMVQLFLESNAKQNVQEKMDGQSPLHFAVSEGNAKTLKLILDSRANPNIRDIDGWTPLYESFIGEDANLEISEILLKYGADPNISDNSGSTPLHSAALSGDLDAFKLLLEYSADPTLRDDGGKTPIDYLLKHVTQSEVDDLLNKIEP